jgi:hypothetical protein
MFDANETLEQARARNVRDALTKTSAAATGPAGSSRRPPRARRA